MKFFVAVCFSFGILISEVHAAPPKQFKKTSTKKIDVQSEVKSFYSQLLTSDADIKKQFESLVTASKEDNGGDFHIFVPQVIEWFPMESHWNVSKGFDSDGRYLIIQPVGLGRGKAEGYDNAIVSEVQVTTTGITKYDDSYEASGREPTLVSNTITITFLGFRRLSLKSTSEAQQGAAANP